MKPKWIGPKLIARSATAKRIKAQAAVIFQFQICPMPTLLSFFSFVVTSYLTLASDFEMNW